MKDSSSVEGTRTEAVDGDACEEVLVAAPRSIGGGVFVRRYLPSAGRQRIGPFIFFDMIGPAALPPDGEMKVRPHPHINLATVTYLLAGEIIHRDSLGSHQAIRPGDINWMTAGRGIVHSERSPSGRREATPLHGIQLWVALPAEHEEVEPEFDHYPRASLPVVEQGGATVRVLAGAAYGATSPVKTLSPLIYADIMLRAGASHRVTQEHRERALFLPQGPIEINGARVEAPSLVILAPGVPATIRAPEATRALLVGGEPLAGERHLWWNFVSSRPERIAAAKADWREGRFPKVPGDEVEFIPLPEG
ncbi:MAG: pirin family protein [Nannocystaceae bacterium]